jgi:hypothetical protein
MGIWRDSISQMTPEERKVKGYQRAINARDEYVALMQNQPDEDGEYRRWAIKKALGLRVDKRNTAQAIGGKHWIGWGAKHHREKR